jgi:hypothetical protein
MLDHYEEETYMEKYFHKNYECDNPNSPPNCVFIHIKYKVATF